jgi:hypothetical protein
VVVEFLSLKDLALVPLFLAHPFFNIYVSLVHPYLYACFPGVLQVIEAVVGVKLEKI